ncbi:MAG TPA: HAD-IA family hydrolase, partial [Bacteroidia bacterium]
HWHGKFPWSNRTLEEVEEDVLAEVSALIRAKGTPMRGAAELIALLKNEGLKLAVASSSYLQLIETVLERFNIRHFFDAVHSAQFERKGKPHPDIYLSTAKTLKVLPAECLAFEDSYNGVLSAKAAGMFTIAVPDPAFFEEPGFNKADLKIRSLADFDKKILGET